MRKKKGDEPVKPFKNIPVSLYCDPTLFLEDEKKRWKKEDESGETP